MSAHGVRLSRCVLCSRPCDRPLCHAHSDLLDALYSEYAIFTVDETRFLLYGSGMHAAGHREAVTPHKERGA